MEERSIKKGYDVVLTEVNNPNLWITEVKSGKLHSNKSSNQTMNDLLGTAKRDLKERLNEENISLWLEAINGAKVSFDSNNTMKSAVLIYWKHGVMMLLMESIQVMIRMLFWLDFYFQIYRM